MCSVLRTGDSARGVYLQANVVLAKFERSAAGRTGDARVGPAVVDVALVDELVVRTHENA
jgi:hypothetical protein